LHEIDDIEFELWDEAERISEKYNGAPVVIILGGDEAAQIRRNMVSSSLHSGKRLRDLLGLLESAKQIESLKHFKIGDFCSRMNETKTRREDKSKEIQLKKNTDATSS
jgi:hypothetical protein